MLTGQLLTALLALCLSCPGPIEGTAGDDRLRGTLGDDVIHGHRGDDRLYGRRGSDVLNGGRGDDVLREWNGAGSGGPLDTSRDVFRGGPGNDVLRVSHNDDVKAGAGDDHVWAYYLDETDFIDCGPGFDVLHLHQNLHDLSTVGCEEWDVQIAG